MTLSDCFLPSSSPLYKFLFLLVLPFLLFESTSATCLLLLLSERERFLSFSLGEAKMQTRRGFCYNHSDTNTTTVTATAGAANMKCLDASRTEKRTEEEKKKKGNKRKRREVETDGKVVRLKRLRTSAEPPPLREEEEKTKQLEEDERRRKRDFFDGLPDDIVLIILSKLSSSVSCPADFIRTRSICKRLKKLCLHPQVLSKASAKSFAVTATSWSEDAHRFMKQCADAGNLEACYMLGMIRFYCLENRAAGASLLAKAATGSHAAALYSLAVIQFNGSGGSKTDKDLRAGAALCARAAYLGHIDALRELGHCLQDGYGIRQNVAEGRRFLIQANARELAGVLSANAKSLLCHPYRQGARIGGCSLLSDFGCQVPQPQMQPANRFLLDWFTARQDGGGKDDEKAATVLRLCSHGGCGRPETRRHEFRRCSVCGRVNYCSRACQALDWKLRHKTECRPMERWVNNFDGGGAAVVLAAVGRPDLDADVGNLDG